MWAQLFTSARWGNWHPVLQAQLANGKIKTGRWPCLPDSDQDTLEACTGLGVSFPDEQMVWPMESVFFAAVTEIPTIADSH